jgi:hypothetical protein
VFNDPKLLGVVLAAISLIWNLLNTVFSRSLEERLRQRALRIEEFRAAVRQPIELALLELDDQAVEVELMDQAWANKPPTMQELISLNRSVTAATLRLSKRLQSADDLHHRSGQTWIDDYYAKEDQILDGLNAALDDTLAQGLRQKGLSQAQANITLLRKKISLSLSAELKALSTKPNKQSV